MSATLTDSPARLPMPYTGLVCREGPTRPKPRLAPFRPQVWDLEPAINRPPQYERKNSRATVLETRRDHRPPRTHATAEVPPEARQPRRTFTLSLSMNDPPTTERVGITRDSPSTSTDPRRHQHGSVQRHLSIMSVTTRKESPCAK